MLKTDINELEYFIHKRGFSKQSLSKKIGINRNTLSLYLNKPESMTIEVVNQITLILELNAEEFNKIFFYG